jgi:hypothetical protein
MNQIITEYKNQKITIEEAILQLDKDNYTAPEIKKGGIVYTPKYIADYIVNILNPGLYESVFEPSIGHGIFIFSLLEFIINKYDESVVKDYFLNKVSGTDIKENNISEVADLISVWFGFRNIKISKKEVLSRLTIADTLSMDFKADIMFGNPPYIRIQNIEGDVYRDYLRKTYKSCEKGNIDIYYAFIEYAHKNSQRCSFIVPSSYIKNTSGKSLRSIIAKDLYSIIDFRERKVFKGVGTYTSIFHIDKKIKGKSTIKSRFGHGGDYTLAGLLNINFDKIKNDDFIKNKVSGGKKFNIDEVYGSIATLRDKIYLLKDNLTSTGISVDLKDTVSYLKCTKLKNIDDIKNNTLRMITPYKLNGKLEYEVSIGKDTMSYLKSQKTELGKRDKGSQGKYERWFSYGRTQGLDDKTLTAKEDSKYSLIIIPGMFNDKNNFFSFKYSDIGENYYLTSGFILKIADTKTPSLLKYLNSSAFIALCDEYGTVRPGKASKYYSISKKVMLGILSSK